MSEATKAATWYDRRMREIAEMDLLPENTPEEVWAIAPLGGPIGILNRAWKAELNNPDEPTLCHDEPRCVLTHGHNGGHSLDDGA